MLRVDRAGWETQGYFNIYFCMTEILIEKKTLATIKFKINGGKNKFNEMCNTFMQKIRQLTDGY